jgi:MFS family permease
MRQNNKLINICSLFGKTIGAVIGGKLIENGRRSAFIKYNLLAILASLIMQYLSLFTLCLGSFLQGICIIIVQISISKMINESIPVYKLGSVGVITPIGISFGYVIFLAMSTFLPDKATDKQNEIYKNDTFWRWLYLFPSLLNLVMVIVFILFIKEDSIIYNLSKGQDKQALNLI